MPEPKVSPALIGPAAEEQMRRLTRRGFLTGAVAAAAAVGGWRWLTTAAPEGGIPWPLRRMLEFNQNLAERYFSTDHLAPTFDADRVAGEARTNGLVGLNNDETAAVSEIRVQHEGRNVDQVIGMAALREMPHTDLVTELKCVEGWSQVMHFGGVRFSDFIEKFGLATRSGRPLEKLTPIADIYRYVYMATPAEDYYVGLDIASALHPQTLLCDTMNWKPLGPEHGAPLRLYLAVKYGFKSIKRIGLIRFQDERPRDYWGERGYDWYAGL